MQVFIDVNGNSKGTVITTQNDNLTDIHTLVIVKNNARYDLTNKIVKMVAVHESEMMGDVFYLDINNPAQGEISLPITSKLTRKDGLLNCQIGIFGENGFLENTARFSIFVKNNLFDDFLDILNNKFDFGIIGESLSKVSQWNNEFKDLENKKAEWQANEINREYNEERRKQTFNSIVTGTKDTNLDKTIEAEVISARGTSTNLTERLNNLEDDLYVPIKISNFESGSICFEKGSTTNKIPLSWTLNKTPKGQTVNGQSIDVTARSFATTEDIIEDTVYTLEVEDERGTKDSAKIDIKFINNIYYGVSESTTYNADLITSLNKVLNEDEVEINVDAGTTKYIYFCCPSRLNDRKFFVFNMQDDFLKVATIAFTNANNYTENYDIYRSENVGLGALNIEIR